MNLMELFKFGISAFVLIEVMVICLFAPWLLKSEYGKRVLWLYVFTVPTMFYIVGDFKFL